MTGFVNDVKALVAQTRRFNEDHLRSACLARHALIAYSRTSDDNRAMARPSDYTPELADIICERLANGEPLAKICRDDDMPGYSTVRRWESDKPEFQALSLRARMDGTHFLADDSIRIADDTEIDPQHKRIMVDTRLRLIGKWNRKDYGEKNVTELTGADGGPVKTEAVVDWSKMSTEALREFQEAFAAGKDK